MAPLSASEAPAHPFFNVDVRISLASSPLGPMGRLSYRNKTKTSAPFYQLLGACDIILPMSCSAQLASAVVDSSFHAGVPVVPPPAGMACDAARGAVMGYGAMEWVSSPASQTGGLDYSGIVRGLIANTSTWPVAGMFPPRLVRAKLRASSLAYWAGWKHLQTAFEISLERMLRMSLDAQEISQQQQEQRQLFRFVPSSIFDCRKLPPFRGGGERNTCVHVSARCISSRVTWSRYGVSIGARYQAPTAAAHAAMFFKHACAE